MKTLINKDKSSQRFHIEIKVRDKNGKIFRNEKGVKATSIDVEATVYTWVNLEWILKNLCRNIKTISPKGSDVNLSANIYNSISQTWMNMASYYGNENRFIKH